MRLSLSLARLLLVAGVLGAPAEAGAADQESIERGKYIFDAAGCGSCHGGDQNGAAPSGGLGLDTPWYLAELTAIGYVPIVAVVLALAWVAVAAQLLVVSTGRYAAYPGAAEGAPPGLVRSSVRTVVLGLRMRRRGSDPALKGH